MMNMERQLLDKAYKRIKNYESLVNQDIFRQEYHIQPPVGFLNDPNGFIQFNGEYHIFYQYNPFYPEEKTIFWGHVKSKDLTNWQSMPLALSPANWYETHGCYSGSAIDNEGKLTLMYTGNVKDEKGNRETYQCLAESTNGIEFTKYPNNPVISHQPQGYTPHFRDPKLWKKDNLWYMVIGAQSIDKHGKIILYKSPDIKNWTMIGEVAGSNIGVLGNFGYMWECPNLFSIGDKDVLIACPQGLKPEGMLYNNLYQCGYMVGKLNYKTGFLDHNGFIELDRGFDFYAPQITVDDKNRILLISWMGMPGEEHPSEKCHWVHCLTLPRELKLVNGKIHQIPVDELKTLRKDETAYENIIIENEEISLEGIDGIKFDLEILLEEISAEDFGLKMRCSENNDEYTLISFNLPSKTISVDRNNSGQGLKGIRKCKLDSDVFKIQIFSDNSSLEIFINHGEEVFTQRIYPDISSKDIKLYSYKGITRIKSIKKWNI